jgi:hypothetical protein
VPLLGNLHELFQTRESGRADNVSHIPLNSLIRAPVSTVENFERFALQGSRGRSAFLVGTLGLLRIIRPAAYRDALAELLFRRPFVPATGVDGLELTNSTAMLAAWI